MNLLKSAFLVSVVAFSFFFANCLKSNCTDQVKNSELYGIWYFYKAAKLYWSCDSIDSKGNQINYTCECFRLERIQFQFSTERFIEEEHKDSIFEISKIDSIDSNIVKINKLWFFTWGYNFHSLGENDWFVDNDKLVICENNSLCFESECNVYTWKIENGKLFLQDDWTTYFLTREDLFEKIKNSVKPDSLE